MQKSLWRGVLIVLSTGLAMSGSGTPTRLHPNLISPNSGDGFKKLGDEIVIGTVVVSAAIAVLVTVLILHHKSKTRAISGCVRSGASGMSVTDDRDKRNYLLSGDTAGLKTGDRMTLEGKRRDTGKVLGFAVRGVTRDFGACPA